MKPRKIPMRMCVGCREMKPKKELMRIVKSPDPENRISLDRVGKAPGRGAYLCHDVACLQKARKAKTLERMLEHSIGEEVYAQLEAEFGKDAP